jgi:hypothetical protein
MKDEAQTRKSSSKQQPSGHENSEKVPTGEDLPKEVGGRKTGREPTRYGDWEKNGRCIDF